MVCCGLCKADEHTLLTTYLAADVTWMWIQGFRAFFGAIWDGGWWNAFVTVVIFAGCIPPFVLCIINHRREPRDRLPKWYLIYAMKNFLMCVFSFLWMMVVFGWKWPSAGLIWLISVPFFATGTFWAYACSGASLKVTNQGPKNRANPTAVLPQQVPAASISTENGVVSVYNNGASTYLQAPVAVVSAQPAITPIATTSRNVRRTKSSVTRSRRNSRSSEHNRRSTKRSQVENLPDPQTLQIGYTTGLQQTLDVRQSSMAMSNELGKSVTSLNTEYTLGTTPGSTLSRDVLSSSQPLHPPTTSNQSKQKVLHAASIGRPAPKPARRRSKSNSTLQLDQVGMAPDTSSAQTSKSATVSPSIQRKQEPKERETAHATAVAMAIYGVSVNNDKLITQRPKSAVETSNYAMNTDTSDDYGLTQPATYHQSQMPQSQQPQSTANNRLPTDNHQTYHHRNGNGVDNKQHTDTYYDQNETYQPELYPIPQSTLPEALPVKVALKPKPTKNGQPKVIRAVSTRSTKPTYKPPTVTPNDINGLIKQFEAQRQHQRLANGGSQSHIQNGGNNQTNEATNTLEQTRVQIEYTSQESLFDLENVRPMPAGTVLDARQLSPQQHNATTEDDDDGADNTSIRIGRRQMVQHITANRQAPQPPSLTVKM